MSLPKALFTNTGVMLEDQVATARPAIRFRSNLATMTDNPTLEATEIDLRPIEEMFTGGSPTEYGYEENEIFVQPTGTINSFNPAGIATATHVVLHSDTKQITYLNGMEPPVAEQPRVRRFSISGNLTVVFRKENVSATASHRFAMGDPVIYASPGDSGLLIYSVHSQRWSVVLTALSDEPATVSLGGGTHTSFELTAEQERSSHWRLTSSGALLQGLKTPFSRTSALRVVRFTDEALIMNGYTLGLPPIYIDGVTHYNAYCRFVAGGHAIFVYDWWGHYWMVFPLSGFMRWDVEPLSSTALAFNSDSSNIWVGTATPTFTYSSAGTRINCKRRIFFPAGSITSLALSTDLDPTGTQAANFTGSGNAHVMIIEYEEFSSIRHCFTTVRRVTKLP